MSQRIPELEADASPPQLSRPCQDEEFGLIPIMPTLLDLRIPNIVDPEAAVKEKAASRTPASTSIIDLGSGDPRRAPLEAGVGSWHPHSCRGAYHVVIES